MGGLDGREEALMTLADLRPGQAAEIVAVTSADAGRLMKLSALGLVPGSRVRLQQRRPAYVVWVGETQLSIDAVIAREIVVRRE